MDEIIIYKYQLKEIQNALKVNRETRVKYHEEDQQMLIRLVKISSSMWT